jgi:hypothetical protein
MSESKQWVRDLARAIFNAQTEENGGLMRGGFGFLHPNVIAGYERLAVETVEASRKLTASEDAR